MGSYSEKPRLDSILVLFVCFVFFETGFLCSPDCLGTSSIDQAGLRDLNASAFWVLELKAHTTTAWQCLLLLCGQMLYY